MESNIFKTQNQGVYMIQTLNYMESNIFKTQNQGVYMIQI